MQFVTFPLSALNSWTKTLTPSLSTYTYMLIVEREGAYDGVEESGFADVGEANDAGSKAHANFGG